MIHGRLSDGDANGSVALLPAGTRLKMSGETNPEVVGCDASIMRNVWEIRLREFGQRMLLEQERLERSALPAINKEWADRMTAKMGKHKRVERRVTPSDIQPDDNIWKSKQPPVPQAVPLGRGSGPVGRSGVQTKSFSAQTPNLKGKKVQNKSVNKLQLLMSITKTQPSSLVWGKSWKSNKSLPTPAEGASPDWGQCWMFAPYQPRAEEGKPWPNEPNLVDPESYHLWRKDFHKMVQSQELDLKLPADKWQTSWKRFEKIKKDSAEDEEKASKHGFFTSLVETQHQNELLCSSEWSDSWTSTKPGNEDLLNATVDDNKDMGREINPEWEECWRLLNHHGSNSFKLPRHQKSLSPEWASSWRTAGGVFNNKQSSSQNQHHGFDDHSLERDGFHKITSTTHKRGLQFYDKFEAMGDWSNWDTNWEIPKNNSKPCAEIDKVLKSLPPKIETQRVEKIPQVNYLTEKADPRYEQLRREVIHHTRRELPESKILLLKHLQKILPPSEWRDSWKVIKHRIRQERRRYKPDPLKPFRESEKGEDSKSNASDWKDSWKFTCRSLNQNPELWQQGWSTSIQVRVNWERHQSQISVEEFPKNGPTSERVWGESYKFSRHQHRSEPAQAKDQVGKRKLNVPDNSREHGSHAKSMSDWQDAWMITETDLKHDKPSFAQWRESWKWSIYHTPHWTGLESTDKWVDESTEIQRPKNIMSSEGAKAKVSRSFDSKIFGQRYPEKQWISSWSIKSLLNNQSSKSSSSQQQHPILSECGCKWGRSFRLANPTPQLDQPWMESPQNPGYHQVLWSSKNKIQTNNKSDLNKVLASATFWANSYRFLQKPNDQLKTKGRSKELSDQRVILPTKIKMRKQLYSGMEKEKQSERKWAGCHLLGKTQPRPKKGSGSNSKLMPEDSAFKKFLEEWGESWRFFIRPKNIKKQMSFKLISGWDESWKFLLPLN